MPRGISLIGMPSAGSVPDKPDLDVLANLLRRIVRAELVADPLVRRFQLQMRVAVPAIGAVGRTRQAVEFSLVIGLDQTLADDHPHQDSDREGAAAEAKAEQLIAIVAIVAAGKFVERDDVAPQADPERAA